MTRKFQPRLQGIQSATGENLTEAAQIADTDRWKGYCEDLYCDEEGKGIEQEYWEQQPPPLRSEVARAIVRQQVAKPQVLTGAYPENEPGGGQFRGSGGRKSPSGVQGRSPGRGSRGRSPPEADAFSQLKGY